MSTLESQPRPAAAPWSTDDAAALYQVDAWGDGYVQVAPEGTVQLRPDPERAASIDLHAIVTDLHAQGIEAPVLLRFPDLLAHRLRRLNDAFRAAMAENDYRGTYRAAYPIKVNQQRPVVEEVRRHGTPYGVGLEVGSKPELLAVLALTADDPDRLIICNGFKDESYLEAVVLATKLGRTVIPVIEKAAELPMVLRLAETYGVRPRLGVRVKLASQGAGRWRDSAGSRSKFGLFVSELLTQFEVLRAAGMADCLELLHCHAGSQLHDVRRVRDAVGELAHVYTELIRLGAGLTMLDVGGGLGVDYTGGATSDESSMNYSIEAYASEVVYRIATVCNDAGVEHPTIITESGRAIAAYQSVLVFNVLGSTGFDGQVAPSDTERATLGQDAPPPLRDLLDAYDGVEPARRLECYHDAVAAREDAQQLFTLGYLTLPQRGLADRLFWGTCERVLQSAPTDRPDHEELTDLERILSDTYFCNVSVFQSLPDSWAIGQLFPIMPIHRLDERPTRHAILADITCDSDGRIDRFVDTTGDRTTLPVHGLRPGDPYYLAAFLVGAYQETLGDLHNLFGDTHVVHLSVDDAGAWTIEEIVRGDTAREVLSYVQYDVDQLTPHFNRECSRAVANGRLTVEESRRLQRFYASELDGYTYLVD